jgi:hypothetical protein
MALIYFRVTTAVALDSPLQMQLHKVAVNDEMVRTNLLTVEDLGTPHARELQVSGNVFVN